MSAGKSNEVSVNELGLVFESLFASSDVKNCQGFQVGRAKMAAAQKLTP